jgi:FixJ family two-component response regulator
MPGEAEPATVFVIDDDEAVRRALTRLITSAGYRVRACGSAREFLDQAPHGGGLACLVLDVRMPDLSGLDLQRELHAARMSHPIVFITGHGDIPMSVEAMKNGAVDFIPKPVRDQDLLRAVHQAVAQSVRERAKRAENEAIQARANLLTPREREVMAWVVTGLLNKQIAAQLGTVEKTVKVHRARVMQKMQVTSVAELVRVAQTMDLPIKHPS